VSAYSAKLLPVAPLLRAHRNATCAACGVTCLEYDLDAFTSSPSSPTLVAQACSHNVMREEGSFQHQKKRECEKAARQTTATLSWTHVRTATPGTL